MSENTGFEEMLERFGQIVYPNKGTSMKPLIRQGRDLMVIVPKGPGPCKRYDAVLFRRPGAGKSDYVLHRILRVNGDGSYWIVGDNLTTGDTVREEQIIGVLQAVIRNGRTIPVTSPACRAYVLLWCGCYPLRFAALRARRSIIRWMKKKKRR